MTNSYIDKMLERRKMKVGGKSTNPLDDPTDNKTYIGGATTPEELSQKITDAFKNALIKSKKIKENLKERLKTVVQIKSGGGLIVFQPPEGESIPQITKFIHISQNKYQVMNVSNAFITTDIIPSIPYDSTKIANLIVSKQPIAEPTIL
jgi:hypothetical protein